MDNGLDMLRKMARARRFNRWMAGAIAPFMAGSILEVGAGIGNLTNLLSAGRSSYVATDTDEEHLAELQQRLGSASGVRAVLWDAARSPSPENFPGGCFDTVVCLNVLEHIPDDEAALRHIYACLRPGGRAVLLVPQGRALYGSLDELLEHQRRYTRRELASKLTRTGFRLERMLAFNRITYPGWFLNARLLRRRTLSTSQLAVFDTFVPLWRRLDRLLPWPSVSLIAIAVREPDAG